LIDMGAMQAGYASDMTRMLHLGNTGQKARKLYKAVLEAQLAGLSAVRENTTAGAVDRGTRQVLKAHGYEKLFVHSTGHGLGLEIHEPPRVGKKDKTVLKAGMVITIEPGAYIEGFGGVRIEDTVLVTKTGCEVLTPTPKELIVV
jgi:Xaa-Pro aminopeptidase